MKRYIGKYLMLLGGLFALAPMSGCKLEDPVIPTEELYLRNFIKKYGLIDPTQDFSSAVQTNVTLNLPSRASTVNVFAQVGDLYYRVGCFADLMGSVTLPVDVSEATVSMLLDVDGVRYYTVPDGVVDVKSTFSTASVPASSDLTKLWINDWAKTTRTNGETGVAYNSARQSVIINNDGSMGGPLVDDEFIDVRATAHVGKNLANEAITDYTKLGEKDLSANPNKFSGQWCYNDCEVGNTHVGSNVYFRIENRDDVLSSYRFTFRTASRNDASVRAVILGRCLADDGTLSAVKLFMDSQALEVESNYKGQNTGTYNTDETDNYTEWEVRTDVMPKGEYQLIIIGVDAKENEVTKQEYCGNWGFMKISRLTTSKDMRWILACEDLGTTDDFDFNDVVLSIEAVNTNRAAVNLGVAQWQVVEIGNDNGFVLGPTDSQSKAPSRADADVNSENLTQLTVTALAAGGTLPIWLHFREPGGVDYLVLPKHYDKDNPKANGCLKVATQWAAQEVDHENNGFTLEQDCGEWHRWFGINNSTDMLNTGVERHRKGTSVTFYTSKIFTLENFCFLQFVTEDKDPSSLEGDQDKTTFPSFPYLKGDQDEWAQKVLQWQWQQEHSQEVTYGFFLTVYHPLVDGTESISDEEAMKGHILSKTLPGLPPQMIMLPDCNPLRSSGYIVDYGWMWPCERVDITDVYPVFKEWVEDGTSISGFNWFIVPKAGIVAQDNKLYPRDPALQEAYVPFPLKGYKDNKNTGK